MQTTPRNSFFAPRHQWMRRQMSCWTLRPVYCFQTHSGMPAYNERTL